LLDENKEEGIEHVEKAMQIDSGFSTSGLDRIYIYLLDQGKVEAAEAYKGRLAVYDKLLKKARIERKTGLKGRSHFMEHRLSPFIVELLKNQLSVYPQIKAVYLAAIRLQYLSEKPLYVMGVVASLPWYRKVFRTYKMGKELSDELVFALSRPIGVNRQQDYFLVASHKGSVIFEDLITTMGILTEVSYSKSRFPLGISKISLLDDRLNIVSERLIFVMLDIPNYIRLKTDTTQYAVRSKVKVEVNSLLEPEDSINAGLSVAVVNNNYMSEGGPLTNLTSYMLLDSELRGRIEHSARFFIDEEELSSHKKLDLLMMVQGWRSYYFDGLDSLLSQEQEGWDDIGLTITGRVKYLFRDKPVVGGRVRIGPYTRNFIVQNTKTDEAGRFGFERIVIEHPSNLMLSAWSKSGRRNTEIILDDIYSPNRNIDTSHLEALIMDMHVPDNYYRQNYTKLEAEKKYAIESGSFWLDEVEVVTEVPESFTTFAEEGQRLYGYADHSLQISEDDMTYNNIYDYLEGRIPGVLVNGTSVSIRGGGQALFIIDGMEDDFGLAPFIQMGDIDHVDIIKGAQTAAFGSKGADGVIAIYTRSGVDIDFTRYVRGRLTRVVNGFQLPQKFYQQEYTEESKTSEIPDYRPTLFWEPALILENNTAEFEFFTSDFRAPCLIIVEGVSKEGKFCSSVLEFDVQ